MMINDECVEDISVSDEKSTLKTANYIFRNKQIGSIRPKFV